MLFQTCAVFTKAFPLGLLFTLFFPPASSFSFSPMTRLLISQHLANHTRLLSGFILPNCDLRTFRLSQVLYLGTNAGSLERSLALLLKHPFWFCRSGGHQVQVLVRLRQRFSKTVRVPDSNPIFHGRCWRSSGLQVSQWFADLNRHSQFKYSCYNYKL